MSTGECVLDPHLQLTTISATIKMIRNAPKTVETTTTTKRYAVMRICIAYI